MVIIKAVVQRAPSTWSWWSVLQIHGLRFKVGGILRKLLRLDATPIGGKLLIRGRGVKLKFRSRFIVIDFINCSGAHCREFLSRKIPACALETRMRSLIKINLPISIMSENLFVIFWKSVFDWCSKRARRKKTNLAKFFIVRRLRSIWVGMCGLLGFVEHKSALKGVKSCAKWKTTIFRANRLFAGIRRFLKLHVWPTGSDNNYKKKLHLRIIHFEKQFCYLLCVRCRRQAGK